MKARREVSRVKFTVIANAKALVALRLEKGKSFRTRIWLKVAASCIDEYRLQQKELVGVYDKAQCQYALFLFPHLYKTKKILYNLSLALHDANLRIYK